MPARRRLKLWFKVAVTTTLLGLIALVVPWAELWSGVREFPPGIWAGVFVLFALGHLAGAFKWRLNVNIGRAGLGRTDAVQIYAAGLFANLCLPSIVGGDGLKAVLAGRTTGRYEAAIFGGLCERLIDTFALLVLIVGGALASSASVPGWTQRVMLVGGLVGVVGVALFLPLALRMRLERLPRKVRRPAGRAMVAMRRLKRRPQLALFVLAMSLGIQSWFVLLNAWLGHGLGLDVSIAFWFLAIPLAKAVTLLPISVGGFGVREATLVGILGIVGVENSGAVLVSLLWQSVLVATGLVGGLVWFLLGLREEARTGGGRDSLFSLEAQRAPESNGA